jgi:hypothetical protein
MCIGSCMERPELGLETGAVPKMHGSFAPTQDDNFIWFFLTPSTALSS